MTKKSNTPDALIPKELLSGPLPIVITGTFTRDEYSLRLVQRLNELSASGKIEVFYFPDSDLDSPMSINVSGGKKQDVRLVNPVRVPEDLEVTSSVSARSESEYYRFVDERLRSKGTPAYLIAFPEQGSGFYKTFEFKYQGQYDDIKYGFQYGNTISIEARFKGEKPFININHLLGQISGANIAAMVLIPGPEKALEFDREATQTEVEEALLKDSNSKYNQTYLDGILNHIESSLSETFGGNSSTKPLDDAGVAFETHESTKDLANAVIGQLEDILGIQGEIEDAKVTAARIVEEANEKAARVINQAQEQANELTDAAIEAGQLIPEIPQILKSGPLSQIASIQARDLEKRKTQEQIEIQELQGAIKNQLDIYYRAFDKMLTTRISSWGAGWGTESYRVKAQQVIDAVRAAIHPRNSDIPDIGKIEKLIDAANLGHGPLSLNMVPLAAGAYALAREFPKMDTYRKLHDYNSDFVELVSQIDNWDIDQGQFDQAVFRSLVSHCMTHGFSDADRAYLETCDHVLKGEISSSLRRSLDRQSFDQTFDELEAIDPFSKAHDTKGILEEVQNFALEQKIAQNGGHVTSSLSRTMDEIRRATPRQSTVDQTQQAVMQSDGTVVQFPGR